MSFDCIWSTIGFLQHSIGIGIDSFSAIYFEIIHILSHFISHFLPFGLYNIILWLRQIVVWNCLPYHLILCRLTIHSMVFDCKTLCSVMFVGMFVRLRFQPLDSMWLLDAYHVYVVYWCAHVLNWFRWMSFVLPTNRHTIYNEFYNSESKNEIESQKNRQIYNSDIRDCVLLFGLLRIRLVWPIVGWSILLVCLEFGV